jgi:hypothetical protein
MPSPTHMRLSEAARQGVVNHSLSVKHQQNKPLTMRKNWTSNWRFMQTVVDR